MKSPDQRLEDFLIRWGGVKHQLERAGQWVKPADVEKMLRRWGYRDVTAKQRPMPGFKCFQLGRRKDGHRVLVPQHPDYDDYGRRVDEMMLDLLKEHAFVTWGP